MSLGGSGGGFDPANLNILRVENLEFGLLLEVAVEGRDMDRKPKTERYEDSKARTFNKTVRNAHL